MLLILLCEWRLLDGTVFFRRVIDPALVTERRGAAVVDVVEGGTAVEERGTLTLRPVLPGMVERILVVTG